MKSRPLFPSADHLFNILAYIVQQIFVHILVWSTYLLPERELGNYRVGRRRGKGSFATVHFGVRKRDGKHFALKIFPRQKLDRVKWEEERLVWKDLKHENIVQFYDVVDCNGVRCFVLEYVPGLSLYELVKREGKLCEEEAKPLVCDLSSALAYLHERKIVHRDVTLVNILTFFRENMQISVKLTDFGMATKATGLLFHPCGTADYLAPEILSGKGYGVSVDIWALGVATFYMLNGHWPFRDDGADDQSIYQSILKHMTLKEEAKKIIFSPRHHQINLWSTNNLTISIDWQCLENIWMYLNTVEAGRKLIFSRHQELANISTAAQDLILQMFRNPKERITAKKIATHPWFSTPL